MVGETWVIHRTCGQRIEEIENISVYRAVVTAIFNVGGPSIPGTVEKEYFFPDPSSYAAEIEAAPHVIEKKAKTIGETMVADSASVREGDPDSGTIHNKYSQISYDLKHGLSKHNIDELWAGSASEQFTDMYLVELQNHLARLAKLCNAHRDAAYAVRNQIAKAHDDLVREVQKMVNYVVRSTGGAAVLTGLGAIGGAIGVGVTAVSTLTALVGELAYFHSSLSSIVSTLNDDLAAELLDAFDDLRAEEFKSAARGVDATSVSRYTWYPASEG